MRWRWRWRASWPRRRIGRRAGSARTRCGSSATRGSWNGWRGVVAFEEVPGVFGEVDVLVRLAEAGPEAGPRLHRVRPRVAHAFGLVVPELLAVGAGPVALSFDRAGREAGVGRVGIALDDVEEAIDCGRAADA